MPNCLGVNYGNVSLPIVQLLTENLKSRNCDCISTDYMTVIWHQLTLRSDSEEQSNIDGQRHPLELKTCFPFDLMDKYLKNVFIKFLCSCKLLHFNSGICIITGNH